MAANTRAIRSFSTFCYMGVPCIERTLVRILDRVYGKKTVDWSPVRRVRRPEDGLRPNQRQNDES